MFCGDRILQRRQPAPVYVLQAIEKIVNVLFIEP